MGVGREFLGGGQGSAVCRLQALFRAAVLAPSPPLGHQLAELVPAQARAYGSAQVEAIGPVEAGEKAAIGG